MVKVTRTDPDHFLEVIANETRKSTRGQLRGFFGACTGVGKTCAMLQAARQRAEDGVAVMVGDVQAHDREQTRRLLEGLPDLPRKIVLYRGLTLQEFDLDGALAACPSRILIDGLAHANAPSSRHAKRWHDVEELLAAGIDVYTTLNVQHLESLSDVVGGIIGIRVRETIPDYLFDNAAAVVLVDLPPDDLLARLHAGNVCLPEAAEQARHNFFRKDNLIALHELALRRVADRVVRCPQLPSGEFGAFRLGYAGVPDDVCTGRSVARKTDSRRCPSRPAFAGRLDRRACRSSARRAGYGGARGIAWIGKTRREPWRRVREPARRGCIADAARVCAHAQHNQARPGP